MCGRFVKKSPKEELRKRFGFDDVPSGSLFDPRYNIAPSQEHPILIVLDDRRQVIPMKWGLVPNWAKDPKIGYKMINARSEGIESKPSFKLPIRKKRCLIMADGFYEWSKIDKKTKVPYFFKLNNGEPFAFAGLWDEWNTGEGVLKTFTIITTTPNELMKPVHNRMPVILKPSDEAKWLDPEITDPREILPLLVPYSSNEMECVRVSFVVNSPRNDVPECIVPVD